jgi:hypothetical protein
VSENIGKGLDDDHSLLKKSYDNYFMKWTLSMKNRAVSVIISDSIFLQNLQHFRQEKSIITFLYYQQNINFVQKQYKSPKRSKPCVKRNTKASK